MQIIEENEKEIYIELGEEDLPYEIPANSKSIYVRFKAVEGNYYMDRTSKTKEELLLKYPL